MMRQLALPLPIAASLDARDVIADASNAAARSWLAKPEAWPLGRLALFGEAGLGKVLAVPETGADAAMQSLTGAGETPFRIGHLVDGLNAHKRPIGHHDLLTKFKVTQHHI